MIEGQRKMVDERSKESRERTSKIIPHDTGCKKMVGHLGKRNKEEKAQQCNNA